MTDLRAQAEAAAAAFDDACRPHYPDGRWGAYRACEFGETLPPEVMATMDAYSDALAAYYAARDGERGFLGARGC